MLSGIHPGGQTDSAAGREPNAAAKSSIHADIHPADGANPPEHDERTGAALQSQNPPSGDAHPVDAPKQGAPARQNLISVDITKLDTLLDLVGEIVINESMVTRNPDLEGLELSNFQKSARQLNKLTDELQDTVMSVRMVPVSMIFQRMRRIVRDMGKNLGKQAELILVGEHTEVDKTILDALGDPLMHLIRNAMDHAIEMPDERVATGKRPTGRIVLSAQNVGGDVLISVSDDGRGMDREKILNIATRKGLLKKHESEYTSKEIYNLVMAPGFSTKTDVSEYSGRGVGMDVVKMNIDHIGGSVIIESAQGAGTNVMMKIPLTLAIIDCIQIALGSEIYAIPITNIRESFKTSAGQLISDPMGNELILLRGSAYPIIRLHETFGAQNAIKNLNDGILLLVDSGDRVGCLLADGLIGKFQIVVKPIPSYLNCYKLKSAGISGCTIMGNGEIGLIVDIQELLG
jgi:two-component system chemotaxis sensor kinase CheA